MAMAVLRRLMALSAAMSFAALLPAQGATLGMLDPDRDGTVDMVETWAAAARLFDRLDRDRDGTLDRRELRGRVSAAEFASADPDRDGTLDKAEYMRIVEARFRAANPDGDFTLDARELASPAGRALLKLLV
jgi:hypothetical protein